MVQCRESDRRNGKRRASLRSSGNVGVLNGLRFDGEYQSDGCLSR